MLSQLDDDTEDDGSTKGILESGAELRDRLAFFEAVSLGETQTLTALLAPRPATRQPPRVSSVDVVDPVSSSCASSSFLTGP